MILTIPPSALTTDPVTQRLSGPHKKPTTSAMSSGRAALGPKLCLARTFWLTASLIGGGILLTMSVSVKPTATVLAVVPFINSSSGFAPSSSAQARARPSSADLKVVYRDLEYWSAAHLRVYYSWSTTYLPGNPGMDARAESEPMLTILELVRNIFFLTNSLTIIVGVWTFAIMTTVTICGSISPILARIG